MLTIYPEIDLITIKITEVFKMYLGLLDQEIFLLQISWVFLVLQIKMVIMKLQPFLILVLENLLP